MLLCFTGCTVLSISMRALKGERVGERLRKADERDPEGGERNANSTGMRPVAAPTASRLWWGKFVQLGIIAIVLIECVFIIHLHVLNSPFQSVSTSYSNSLIPDHGGSIIGSSCSEEWLEKMDRVNYTRDFVKQPVLIVNDDTQEWSTCAVPCVFHTNDNGPADGTFGVRDGVPRIMRSMESSAYYPDHELESARRKGFTVVMTTSLMSDVPVGYFSWIEYPVMDPPQPKTKTALAAAFISNCGAQNGRLRVFNLLQKEGITIDSYGACNQNIAGGRGVDKLEALQKYKFSLAFENSNVEDYVTEKFFQALVAGSIPVVVGAPNIEEFAPAPNSYLYIKDEHEVKSVAAKMMFLAGNATAYDEALRWKYDGPSLSFLALVDMAVVHSSCRLCIHLATRIHSKEEASVAPRRPCQCSHRSGTIHHLYVRERGRFKPESIFLEESNLTLKGLVEAVLQKFTAIQHEPIWKRDRPEMIRGNSNLRVYRIYPVGLTQREALYSWSFKSDEGFKEIVRQHPCSNFEVIFV